MVKRFLKVFSKEVVGINQAAYLLGFFAFLSTVLGLLRDRILARQFGAGEVLDLYYSAFRLPDIIFVTVSSLVGASVLIPFIIKKMDESQEKLKSFLNSIWTFYISIVLFFSLFAFCLAPYFLKIIFPFFGETKFLELVSITRILLISPVLLGLSNLFSSVTQVYKRFFIYAISPIFYNIGIILGALFLFPRFGLKGLALGVVFGALLHFAVQIPFLVKKGLFPRFVIPDFKSIKEVILVSVPRTITLSASELSELFLVSLAGFFIVGSISVFNFSFNLQSVPYSIIGISYSLAAFPTLTKLFSDGQRDRFIEQMLITTRHIIFWSVPVSIFFIVLRAQIVRVLLGTGKFDWSDTKLTAACLAVWSFSLLAQNLSTLFVRSFYSRGKTKEPLYINVFGAVIIICSSYCFLWLFKNFAEMKFFIESIFKVDGIHGTEVLMLPLGYSFGMICILAFHLYSFSKEFKGFIAPFYKALFQVFGASTIAGFFTYRLLYLFDNFFNLNSFFGIFAQGFLSGFFGLILMILILIFMKNQEIFEIFTILKSKFIKPKIILPDAEI